MEIIKNVMYTVYVLHMAVDVSFNSYGSVDRLNIYYIQSHFVVVEC